MNGSWTGSKASGVSALPYSHCMGMKENWMGAVGSMGLENCDAVKAGVRMDGPVEMASELARGPRLREVFCSGVLWEVATASSSCHFFEH